ncbi:MAG: Calx-beta domain-containing protein, partial [Planctomycetota bacterium]
MASVNPLAWLPRLPNDLGPLSAGRPTRRRSLTIQALATRRVLTAIVMTPHEQLLLELINRARADPGAEAARFGIGLNEGITPTISNTPKQPVAPNQILVNAAAAHSQDMIDNDYFRHVNLQGESPSDRAIAAGYPVGVWENIAYGGSTGQIDHESNVYDRHRRLFLSVTGHRENILRESHQEVGTGIRFGQFTDGATFNVGMATEKFANPPGNSFLTGVAFTDASDGSVDDNDFYEIGEQIDSGTIIATNVSTGASFATTIGPSGGYSIQLPPGTYDVTASGGSLPGDYIAEAVTIASQNVKVDFETTTAQQVSNGDPPTPQLSIQLSVDTVAENGGAISATVTRSGDTTSSLVVSFSSNDTSEATVPADVTIPAGSSTATFSVTPVDDDDIDGTQVVTLSAAAAGHDDGSESLSVIDNDAPPEPFSAQFDFGTGSSPLQPDFTRVTGSTTYNNSNGFGWTQAVNQLDRRAGTSLTRDLHYRDMGTFLVDVPNGTYDVTLTVGDSGPSAHDQTIYLEGVAVDSVTTAAGRFVTRTYTTTVSDGQLTVFLDGRGGVDQNMVISGLEVTGSSEQPPDEPEPTPQLSLSLNTGAIAENGGSTSGTVSRTGDTSQSVVISLQSSDTGEATVPATVTILAGQTTTNFNVSGVDDDIVDGTQTITLTAGASGHTGDTETVDVTDDDVPPEEPDGEPVSFHFDFGTTTSPLQSEHIRVTGSSTYNAGDGYGWTQAVNHLDRRSGTSLTRDLHYRDLGTFLVDVPNGTYEVTLTMGDSGPSTHDQTISLEGVTVDSVTTNPGRFVTRTYTTSVTDGQLTVLLDGRGGVDRNMVISGLEVSGTGDPPPDEPDPNPTLSLNFANDTISENGGSTVASVSRSGSTAEAVVISISNSDSGEAAAPTSVTIPAGQASATFTVSGVDDSIVDGTQTVHIGVAASGHDGDSETISVSDDDVPPEEPATDPTPQRYDFGTTSSPLEDGHTRVTGSTTYDTSRGYGWTQSVNHLDRRAGTSLTRDLHYRDVATFLIDVANGTYDVTLTMGDSGPSAHDQTVFLEGVNVDSVTTAPGRFVTRSYSTAVQDGRLTVLLDGRGGVDRNMVLSGLELVRTDDQQPDEPDPELTLSLGSDSLPENGGVTSATVSRSGSNAEALVVTLASSDHSEAALPPTITIAAGQSTASFIVTAVDDDLVDGDQSVTIEASAGGHVGDTSSLTVHDDEVPPEEPVSLEFDFGTQSSPLAEGHIRVAGATTYDAGQGFGWTEAVNQLDRRSGTSLTRDLHYRDIGTFLVDVPNGTYEVTLTVGDSGPSAHDQTISLEGTLVDSVFTSAGRFVTRTYTAVVNDGQLT